MQWKKSSIVRVFYNWYFLWQVWLLRCLEHCVEAFLAATQEKGMSDCLLECLKVFGNYSRYLENNMSKTKKHVDSNMTTKKKEKCGASKCGLCKPVGGIVFFIINQQPLCVRSRKLLIARSLCGGQNQIFLKCSEYFRKNCVIFYLAP